MSITTNEKQEEQVPELSVADAPDYAKKSCNTCLGRGTVTFLIGYPLDRDTSEERPCICAQRRFDRAELRKKGPESVLALAKAMMGMRVQAFLKAIKRRKAKAKRKGK